MSKVPVQYKYYYYKLIKLSDLVPLLHKLSNTRKICVYACRQTRHAYTRVFKGYASILILDAFTRRCGELPVSLSPMESTIGVTYIHVCIQCSATELKGTKTPTDILKAL